MEWTEASALFWEQVEPAGDCWIWTGSLRDGYGHVGEVAGVTWSAHRFAYINLVGPIPVGERLFHECRDRACVNPDHFTPAKAGENLKRTPRGRYNASKTHCPRGHAYDEKNTYRTKRGGRACRTCARERHKPANPQPEVTIEDLHGTTRGYSRGCRCNLCAEAMRAYSRAYAAKKREAEVRQPKSCPRCGTKVERRGAIYCSDACREAAYRDKKPKLPRPGRPRGRSARRALVTEWFIEPDPDLAMLAAIAAEQAHAEPKSKQRRR